MTDPRTVLTALITEHSALTGARAERLADKIAAEWLPAQAVVDREALALALHDHIDGDYLLGGGGWGRDGWVDDIPHDQARVSDIVRWAINAVLAAGVITDAADVRRQTAEDTLRALLSEWQELRDTLAKEENDIHAGGSTLGLTASEATATVREWIRAAIAREVGGDRG